MDSKGTYRESQHAGGEDEPRHFASEPGQTGRGIVVNVINEPVNGIKELVNGINELINRDSL